MTAPGQATTVVPVTTKVERELGHPPEALFAAYADIDQRTRWIAGPDDTISYLTQEFGIGGTDHFLIGPNGGPSYSGILHYEHIVDHECIVFAERLRAADDQLLALSVVAWSLTPSGPGTILRIADQTTSVVGSRPIEGVRFGYEVMVDRLDQYLTDTG